MIPSRSTQPYRRNQPRQPGEVLYAMLQGRDQFGQNPQDQIRESQRKRGSTLQSLLRRY